MKRILSSVMCFLTMLTFCVACFPQAVLAEELTAGPVMLSGQAAQKPNVWNGDKMAVQIDAGSNGYTFRSVYVTPYHAYEMSNHMVSADGANHDIPQTLILVDASESYIWTPNGEFSPASSNYRVLYCCDAQTGYNNGVYYKRLNLEDSSYYTPEAAEHIRSIITYSYPYVDLDVMKARLGSDGFAGADKLTRAEIITAVQSAVWAYANGDGGTYYYSRTFDVPSNSQWGGVVHDYTNEMDVWWTVGKRKFSTNAEVNARINALIDFLINLEGKTAGRDQIIITGLNIVDCVPVNEVDGVYTVALKLNLNTSGNSGDLVDINIFVNGQSVSTQTVVPGIDTYDIGVQAKAGETIKAVVSGKQYVAKGVYFYEAEGGRDASQSLVDVFGGETDVYCEAEVLLPNIPKTPKADIILLKQDNWGNALAGAEFALYVMGGTEYMYVNTQSVNSNGVLGLTGMVPGRYALRETVAPAGFMPLLEDIEFVVTNEGKVEINSLPEYVTASDVGGVCTVSVVNIPEYTSISGQKIWDDENNAAGMRPESITVHLMANGTVVQSKKVTAADNWSWSFENLPALMNGQMIMYSISEDAVDFYETKVDGFNVINKYVPEYAEVAGQKTWNDDNNRDNIRPESITVNLLANGKIVQTKVVTEADGWAWKFAELPMYKDGEAIEYTVSEEPVAGYTAAVDGFNLINTHEPEQVEIKGSKTWNDDNNRDGVRPESITIHLLADGNVIKTVTVTEADGWAWRFTELPVYRDGGVKIAYTIAEEAVEGYTARVDGFNVENTRQPDRVSVSVEKFWNDDNNRSGMRPESVTVILYANGVDTGMRAVLGSSNNWKASFADLKAKQNGEDIVYTISEVSVEGYRSEIAGNANAGFVVTNTYIPQKTSISLLKAWDDDNNRDGYRPDHVLVRLLADGRDTGIVVELSAANGWSATISDLDVYLNGVKVNYTVEEVVPAGYSVSIAGDVARGFVITNRHEPEKIDISGRKIWNDDNNQSGKRPESITINLLANDALVASKVVTAANEWAWTFENLDVYENGSKIAYRITEEAVPGYRAIYQGFNVINIPTDETTDIDISVGKIWDDFDDAMGARPDHVVVELVVNGVSTDTTLTLSAANNWMAAFTGLPLVDGEGNVIHYTVAEREVESYIPAIEGDAASGFVITNTYVEEFRDDPVPESPATGDHFFKFVGVLSVGALSLAAAFVAAAFKLKKKHN